jgi:FkbM family methyltransferase
LRGIAREVAGASRIAADLRSFARLALDAILYRLLRFLPPTNRRRHVRLRGGVRITYRLNRGDFQGVREVWMQEAYRLPRNPGTVHSVVDLGANIGLASVYLARHHGARRVLAVEPVHENAQLAALNLRQNGVSGEVLEAAVATYEGTAPFIAAEASNVGHLGPGGNEVQTVTMESVLGRLAGLADVVKLDIEGAEEDLLKDGGWLQRVRVLVAEFHPDRVDYPGLVRLVCEKGFEYVPAGSVYRHSADTFYRVE